MKGLTRIEIDDSRPIEFLLNADLETELHPGEDPDLGAHSSQVLAEMLKEARCEGEHTGLPPLDFVLSNGDTDARFERGHEKVWAELEQLCPCYFAMGNHEGGYFERDGDAWRRHLGYEDTYYAWEYACPVGVATFVVLDAWCARDEIGKLRINEGSGNQALRDDQLQWLKAVLDGAEGVVTVFAHAHLWIPNARNQDNASVEELVDILKGTYEGGAFHRHASVFINGGHHDLPSCNRVDGVHFIDPIGAIHQGYARVVIDPAKRTMDYLGRFNERTYRGLGLVGYAGSDGR